MKFGVIGTGKLGSTLIKLFSSQNNLGWLVARSDLSYQKATKLCSNSRIYRSIDDIDIKSDCIFICTDDKNLLFAINQLAVNPGIIHEEIIFIHCAGSLSTDAFSPIVAKGATVAACHPYQTFYSESIDAFDHIPWGIECDDDTYPFVDFIIRSMNGIPFRLNNFTLHHKSLYHLSAVASSNLMTAAIQLAKQISETAGIDPTLFLPSILKTTLQNNIDTLSGKDFPLTGPIARGDIEVVHQHMNKLLSKPDLRQSYIAMSIATAKLALSNGLIDEKTCNELLMVLQDENKPLPPNNLI